MPTNINLTTTSIYSFKVRKKHTYISAIRMIHSIQTRCMHACIAINLPLFPSNRFFIFLNKNNLIWNLSRSPTYMQFLVGRVSIITIKICLFPFSTVTMVKRKHFFSLNSTKCVAFLYVCQKCLCEKNTCVKVGGDNGWWLVYDDKTNTD